MGGEILVKRRRIVRQRRGLGGDAAGGMKALGLGDQVLQRQRAGIVAGRDDGIAGHARGRNRRRGKPDQGGIGADGGGQAETGGLYRLGVGSGM